MTFKIINPDTIIGESLETAWGLPQYVHLINVAGAANFQASDAFRKSFNAYYRVRQRKKEWNKISDVKKIDFMLVSKM